MYDTYDILICDKTVIYDQYERSPNVMTHVQHSVIELRLIPSTVCAISIPILIHLIVINSRQ